MSISQAKKAGYKLDYQRELDGIKYMDFSKVLENIQVFARDRLPRELLPVLFRVRVKILKKRMKGATFQMVGKPFLYGHPEKIWHPHVEWQGWCCWGDGDGRLIKEDRSLVHLLDNNVNVAIGVLGDFMRRGYHEPSSCIGVYTKTSPRKVPKGLEGLEALSESFWTGRPTPEETRAGFEVRVWNDREIIPLEITSPSSTSSS